MENPTTSCLLPISEVSKRTSLSRATIWRRISAKDFPAPVRLGPNRVAWRESDVLAWVEGLSADA